MSLITTYSWAVSRTLKGIFRAKALFSLALLLSGLTLSIPLFLGTLSWSLSKPFLAIPVMTEITVFTDRSAGAATVAALSRDIENLNIISKVRLVKKDEALQMVNKNLGLKSRNTKSNPLPDILIASCEPTATSAEIQSVATKIQKFPAVDSVAYDTTWATHLSALKSALLLIFSILGSIVAALVIFVVAASVRLATSTQHDEIRALYLFGASPRFIKRPYVWRGALTLIFAALIALLITYFAISLLAAPLANFATLYSVEITLTMPPLVFIVGFVIAAALLGLIISSIAVGESIRKAVR